MSSHDNILQSDDFDAIADTIKNISISKDKSKSIAKTEVVKNIDQLGKGRTSISRNSKQKAQSKISNQINDENALQEESESYDEL